MYIDYVLKELDDRTLLEQLAEESSELSKAALKLIRAEHLSNNITPVTSKEAYENLREELIDVLMVAYLLELAIPTLDDVMDSPKWERWAKRLGMEQ